MDDPAQLHHIDSKRRFDAPYVLNVSQAACQEPGRPSSLRQVRFYPKSVGLNMNNQVSI